MLLAHLSHLHNFHPYIQCLRIWPKKIIIMVAHKIHLRSAHLSAIFNITNELFLLSFCIAIMVYMNVLAVALKSTNNTEKRSKHQVPIRPCSKDYFLQYTKKQSLLCV